MAYVSGNTASVFGEDAVASADLGGSVSVGVAFGSISLGYAPSAFCTKAFSLAVNAYAIHGELYNWGDLGGGNHGWLVCGTTSHPGGIYGSYWNANAGITPSFNTSVSGAFGGISDRNTTGILWPYHAGLGSPKRSIPPGEWALVG